MARTALAVTPCASSRSEMDLVDLLAARRALNELVILRA
jgi:hypothetical protein